MQGQACDLTISVLHVLLVIGPDARKEGCIVQKRVIHDLGRLDPFSKVLIIQPERQGTATVYCPPIGSEKAWSEEYASIDEAVAVAISLAQRIGQKLPLLTRDRVEW